ncbi:hypothetical protein [Paraburkholderia sp. BR14374]|uniref:hypothetical protein n=1 Tax=Paraburkholderia sp. BR14374 TaxID=3237007 RepID=UPI0034CF4A55
MVDLLAGYVQHLAEAAVVPQHQLQVVDQIEVRHLNDFVEPVRDVEPLDRAVVIFVFHHLFFSLLYPAADNQAARAAACSSP